MRCSLTPICTRDTDSQILEHSLCSIMFQYFCASVTYFRIIQAERYTFSIPAMLHIPAAFAHIRGKFVPGVRRPAF